MEQIYRLNATAIHFVAVSCESHAVGKERKAMHGLQGLQEIAVSNDFEHTTCNTGVYSYGGQRTDVAS